VTCSWEVVALAEFLVLYRGRTISEAQLVAICADKRVVSKFFEELASRPAEGGGCGEPRGHVAELKRGERSEA
jgi:hypothetical protein